MKLLSLLLLSTGALCVTTSQQEDLRAVVDSMLHISNDAQSETKRRIYRPAPASKRAAQAHMQQLYDNVHSSGHSLPHGANVVRTAVPVLDESPLPKHDPPTQVHIVVDAPEPEAQLVYAELCLDSNARYRRSRGWHPLKLYSRALLNDDSSTAHLLHEISKQEQPNKLIYDATAVVQRSFDLAPRNDTAHMVLIFSRFLHKIGQQRDLTAKKVLRRHKPFLLLYFRSAPHAFTKSTRRAKREIIDSKYWLYKFAGPEDHLAATTTIAMPTATPPENILNAQAYLRRGPDLFNTKQEMRQNRRKQKMLIESNRRMGIIDSTTLAQGPCTMHTIDIDLWDIGWQHTIIAPKKLPANYCVGQCQFPLSRASNPSNRALLQSVLNHLDPNITPEPTCAPDRMDALSLLYFDTRGNVVLKTYPKMIVTRCGCI